MRLSKKKQILELINTIEEGIDYACNSSNDNAKVMLQDCISGLGFLVNLLNDVQEIAIQIQDIIYVVQSIQEDAQEHPMFISNIHTIKEMLNDLRYSIINKIDTEIEIAFMPYKFSMWDSLDSIYKEASNDPQCSCYVVPVPYYEKNERGEIITFNYEGSEFPQYTNVIPFELYNFEERKPDIIYIHNPFDEYNKLTMVNPRFFSSNLSKYTEMLVYVPYYVAGSTATTQMTMFPLYNNATKILAQSNVLQDVLTLNGVSAHKILNLGSPKIDAMLSSLKEDIEVPRLWKNVISNKKVFLLNTGIADLLSVDSWFEHIEQVVNYFIVDEKSVLIWRKHPLTNITLSTMRPHLLSALEEIESRVKQSNNIIIDTSSNIYPAVSISDALISDYSSVLMQYITTEKPVLGLLNDKMIEPDRYYYSDYLGCYFIDQDTTLAEFIKMVERDEDYKRNERVSRFKKSMSNSDGTSGQKIHARIKSEVLRNSLMTE